MLHEFVEIVKVLNEFLHLKFLNPTIQQCCTGFEAYKRRLAYSVTVRISKSFIIKVLEYKAKELNLYALLCVP